MRKVLVIHYSQSGQLNSVVNSFVNPLIEDTQVDVVFEELRPVHKYPFPWPFLEFFSVFPEAVHMIPPEMEPLSEKVYEDFDLIILAYQVWFLSPSLPTTGFLRTDAAKKLLNNKAVITLVGCRNMWLMAQEKMKTELLRLGARHIDNVVLTDQCSSAASFLSTPLWMFTGKKQSVSWIPKAGISEEDIAASKRFGEAIKQRLHQDNSPIDSPVLRNLSAVKINKNLIASEKLVQRSMFIWGKLMILLGGQASLSRRMGLCFYICFLVAVILTVVPITALLKISFAPLMKSRIAKQVEYYSRPSGQ